MNSAHTPDQTEQDQELKPDFSHRLSIIGKGAEPYLLDDAISTACIQAENTLSLVSMFFTGQTKDCQPSDELIFWTFEGVAQTIRDISSIVSEFNRVSQSINAGHKKTD